RQAREPSAAPAASPPPKLDPLFDGTAGGWIVEHDANSVGEVEVSSGAELQFRYALGGGSVSGQVVAFAHDVPQGTGPRDRFAFTVRAEHPMRISVQIRSSENQSRGERWRRSVYVDRFDQEKVTSFDDFTSIGLTHSGRPPFADIHSVMFVVDTTNTKPG